MGKKQRVVRRRKRRRDRVLGAVVIQAYRHTPGGNDKRSRFAHEAVEVPAYVDRALHGERAIHNPLESILPQHRENSHSQKGQEPPVGQRTKREVAGMGQAALNLSPYPAGGRLLPRLQDIHALPAPQTEGQGYS